MPRLRSSRGNAASNSARNASKSTTARSRSSGSPENESRRRHSSSNNPPCPAMRRSRRHQQHPSRSPAPEPGVFRGVHMSDAHAAAVSLLGAVLGEAALAPQPDLPNATGIAASREPETGLALRIERPNGGKAATALRPVSRDAEPPAGRAAWRTAGRAAFGWRTRCGWNARRRTSARALCRSPAPTRQMSRDAIAARSWTYPMPAARVTARCRAARPGADGTGSAGRAGCLGPALPSRAGPCAAVRLDAGFPARRRWKGR